MRMRAVGYPPGGAGQCGVVLVAVRSGVRVFYLPGEAMLGPGRSGANNAHRMEACSALDSGGAGAAKPNAGRLAAMSRGG